jgi:hypothetical protein
MGMMDRFACDVPVNLIIAEKADGGLTLDRMIVVGAQPPRHAACGPPPFWLAIPKTDKPSLPAWALPLMTGPEPV